jgi:serine/threonine-protein kinase haspin
MPVPPGAAPAEGVVTFVRRKKVGDAPPLRRDGAIKRAAHHRTPAQPQVPAAAAAEVAAKPAAKLAAKPAAKPAPRVEEATALAPEPKGNNAGGGAARWRRKAAAAARAAQEEARERHVAEIRAHYAEVDAFELTVETPTPPGKAGAAAAAAARRGAAAPRAMALGLERRSSLALRAAERPADADTATPPRAGVRGDASSDAEDADEAGALPAAPRSAARRALDRASAGLGDALAWLGAKGTARRASARPGVAAIAECEDEGAADDSPLRTAFEQTLRLGAAAAAAPAPGPAAAPFEALLELCGQAGEAGALPSMEALLARHADLAGARKVGEGTFGEAFRAGGVVLKIVPMEGAALVNGEPQKRAAEILAEVEIAGALSRLRDGGGTAGDGAANATSGFVELFAAGVCRGRYTPVLRDEWRRWDAAHRSENQDVGAFGDAQLYVVFVVADGGADLEAFEPRSFAELRAVLLQTALALAVAEEACEFEHRDLHWGNVLVARTGAERVAATLRGVDVTAAAAGLTVTLIDFTLSRLRRPTGGGVAFCDLEADPALFAGPRGDAQAETYRRARAATGGNWAAHAPATNALWLAYLAETALAHKAAGARCGGEARAALRRFRRRALAAGSAAELVFDDLFDEQWALASE